MESLGFLHTRTLARLQNSSCSGLCVCKSAVDEREMPLHCSLCNPILQLCTLGGSSSVSLSLSLSQLVQIFFQHLPSPYVLIITTCRQLTLTTLLYLVPNLILVSARLCNLHFSQGGPLGHKFCCHRPPPLPPPPHFLSSLLLFFVTL